MNVRTCHALHDSPSLFQVQYTPWIDDILNAILIQMPIDNTNKATM